MKHLYALSIFLFFNFNSFLANDYIVNSFDNHSIHGTLIESKKTNSDLAIIISGSGPTGRDGNNAALKSDYLKLLAEGLIQNEISSFRSSHIYL